MVKILKLFTLFFSLACSAAWTQPLDLVTERAWLEDPSGEMSLQQVQQSTLQPLGTKEINRGYSSSAFWLRVRIDPTLLAIDSASERLVMRIRSPNLDDVRLFDPLYQGTVPQVNGDRHSRKGNAYRSLNLNFLLKKGQQPRDVWLRITTTSSTLTKLQVLAEPDARALDMEQALWSVGYVAVLLICMGWAAMAWQLLHDRLIVFYILRETAAIAYAFAVLGGFLLVHWDVLPPDWADRSTNFIACALSVTFIWFDIKLLSQFRPHPVGILLLRAAALFCSLAAVLTLVGYTHLGFAINSWVVIFLPLVLLFTALSTRAWSDGHDAAPPFIPRWSLLGLYMIFPALIIVNRAVLLGWIPPVVVASHMLLAYMLVSSVAMMAFLQMRASGIYKQQQEAQVRLRLAEQLANTERARREEQERFLSMLTHELKNPLGVIRISLDDSELAGPQRTRINRALANINSIIDRCAITDQMEHRKLTPELKPLALETLVEECIQGSSAPDRLKFSERKPAIVHSDSGLLAICLANLIDNALKYAPPASIIEVQLQPVPVATDQPASSWKLIVRNAIGPAGAPDPERIFEKYYRCTDAASQSGSGLGLYLTRNLAQLLGARLEYHAHSSSVEFCLCLPA